MNTMNNKENSDFIALIVKAQESVLSQEESVQLNDFMKLPENQKTYFEMMRVAYSLSQIELEDMPYLSRMKTDSILNMKTWEQFAEHEKTAPAIEVPEEKPQRELIQKVVYEPRAKYKLTGFHKFSLAACAAAVLFFVYLYFAPQQLSSIDVATLVDQMDVQWGQSKGALGTGSRLWTHQPPLELQKGIVKIHYDESVDVVIEGPAVFEIERSGIYMEYGRLYGHVFEAGLGFMVQTPTSQVIDLGTEFGIQAEVNGSSELHVMHGKVQLFAGPSGSSKSSRIITENNAVKYDVNSKQVQIVPIEKHAFVRQIDSQSHMVWRGQKSINLADIVGGGNGFGTGQIDKGINQRGQITLLENPESTQTGKKFTSVPASPFVDGIFIPNGRTQIDAAGMFTFDFEITDSRTGMGVLNGAWHHVKPLLTRRQLHLNGIEYGTEEHPAIYIHSNQGVTFDLEAIRQFTRLDISRFHSLCGISETVVHLLEANGSNRQIQVPVASFVVLIDGREVFARTDMTHLQSPAEIDIEIHPDDRYLTLVTTQGSDENRAGDC